MFNFQGCFFSLFCSPKCSPNQKLQKKWDVFFGVVKKVFGAWFLPFQDNKKTALLPSTRGIAGKL
jgi:hypothetical protein